MTLNKTREHAVPVDKEKSLEAFLNLIENLSHPEKKPEDLLIYLKDGTELSCPIDLTRKNFPENVVRLIRKNSG